jgi:hypothetical protein
LFNENPEVNMPYYNLFKCRPEWLNIIVKEKENIKCTAYYTKLGNFKIYFASGDSGAGGADLVVQVGSY